MWFLGEGRGSIKVHVFELLPPIALVPGGRRWNHKYILFNWGMRCP